MRYLYTLSVVIYTTVIKIAALFNKKARKWVDGRKNLLKNIGTKIEKNQKYVWFHAASLGEFEQGRPVIEAFRKQFPVYKIVLTFFSPSGFEIRKNYSGVDFIFYLPVDTPKNTIKFLEIFNPEMVFFIKYEFWFNYINQINKKNIPLFLFSVSFRPDQYFFKWYGNWFLRNLQKISWFFVQDVSSKQLLLHRNIKNCSVSGDTRFDRVLSASIQKKSFPLVAEFSGNSRVFIAGSTWPYDEEFLIQFINQKISGVKTIIAPHEIHLDRISSFQSRINAKSIKFSEISTKNFAECDVLIIDNIGILLHLYQYAQIAYIGGGFGKSIHNILEAATFGIPVIFGPAFHKFKEAEDLISLGGAFPVTNYEEFDSVLQRFIVDSKLLETTSNICRKFVTDNSGATDIIMQKIANNISH
ncbi:MAG: glycosyltransferase N-terminal domain-containing protein [Bacteroidota bacterium]